jgi:hypothetical protein
MWIRQPNNKCDCLLFASPLEKSVSPLFGVFLSPFCEKLIDFIPEKNYIMGWG